MISTAPTDCALVAEVTVSTITWLCDVLIPAMPHPEIDVDLV